MEVGHCILIAILVALARSCFGQVSLAPQIPDELKNLPQVRSFYYLWRYSREADTRPNSPNERVNKDARKPGTLVVLSEFAMANLVPQDAINPLYLGEPANVILRMEFLSDQLIKEKINPNDPALKGKGKTYSTISGKQIHIRNEGGSIYINDIKVEQTHALGDGTQIYILQEPLFNLRKKVNKAFSALHRIEDDQGIGPPLEIPGPPAAIPIGELRVPVSAEGEETKPPAVPEGIIPPDASISLINAPSPPPPSGSNGEPGPTNSQPVGPPGGSFSTFDLLRDVDDIKPPAFR